MKILFRGGRLVDPSQGIDGEWDVWVEEGTVKAVLRPDQPPPGKPDRRFDLGGAVITPGFVDLHVHLREPGQTEKEDIESGTRAAVAGGFTSVLCMPNTKPANDSPETTRLMLKRAEEAGHCRVYPVGAVSKNLEGKELAPLRELKKAGCVAFSDDGRPCYDTALLREALAIANELDLPLIEHCEELSLSSKPTIHAGEVAAKLGLEGIPISAETLDVARTATLAAETGAKVHLAHLSCKESVELVRAFKKTVKRLTAEVTPHHLVLSDRAVAESGTNAKMYPPLRRDEDCAALRRALAEGVIDTVATDHAPHTAREKQLPFAQAPNGVIGLETALPVLLTLHASGELSLSQIIDRLSTAPAKIAGLKAGSLKPGMPADLTVFVLEEERDFRTMKFYSKSDNTPFRSFRGRGRVLHTFVGGRQVYGEAP